MDCPIQRVRALEAMIRAQESGWFQLDDQFAVLEGGIYQHFKGGLYCVLTVAKHTEDKSQLVLYYSLDDSSEKPQIWARPVSMFCGLVSVQGVNVPRFRLVGIIKED